MVHALERARRFNRWLAAAIAPELGDRVLELGAGIGSISIWLVPRDRYVAGEVNPDHFHYLENLTRGKPYMEVARIDVGSAADFSALDGRFDTVLCLSAIERAEDPVAALRNIATVLSADGRVLLYVPHKQRRFCSLDQALGRRRRYDREQLAAQLEAAGLELVSARDFNRAGVPGWWWNGKLLRRRRFGRLQLKLFDLSVPWLRHVDRWLPWSGLGLIAVARKP